MITNAPPYTVARLVDRAFDRFSTFTHWLRRVILQYFVRMDQHDERLGCGRRVILSSHAVAASAVTSSTKNGRRGQSRKRRSLAGIEKPTALRHSFATHRPVNDDDTYALQTMLDRAMMRSPLFHSPALKLGVGGARSGGCRGMISGAPGRVYIPIMRTAPPVPSFRKIDQSRFESSPDRWF